MFARFLPFSFRYLNPGPLIDRELELVTPQTGLIDELLAACHDPSTVEQEPTMASTTRQQIAAFLHAQPGGRRPLKPSQPREDVVPTYFFWMHVRTEDPSRRIAGGVALRIGHSQDLVQYVGHIGYHVYPPSRGNHYAERATRLLLPLARRHRINPLWITCNPDNEASRRTCENLGAELVNAVNLPVDHPLYVAGDRCKCRYRLYL